MTLSDKISTAYQLQEEFDDDKIVRTKDLKASMKIIRKRICECKESNDDLCYICFVFEEEMGAELT